MGEHRLPRLKGGIISPDLIIDPTKPPRNPSLKNLKVPMVPNVKLMNQADDRVVILLLGDDLPRIGTAFTSDEARHLAVALEDHADALDKLDEEPKKEEDGG